MVVVKVIAIDWEKKQFHSHPEAEEMEVLEPSELVVFVPLEVREERVADDNSE